jgi:hypothetical protein
MTTLTVSLQDKELWSAPYRFTVRVDGIDFSVPNKSLVIFSGQSLFYSWIDNTIFTQSGIEQETVVGNDYLFITITVIDAPPPGVVIKLFVIYKDDETSDIVVTREVCVGNIVIFAQSPTPNQIDVPVIAPLILAARVDPGLQFVNSALTLNSILINDSITGAFLRPDFTGYSNIVGNALSVKVVPRRAYDNDASVSVNWKIEVSPDSERRFASVFTWTFYTVKRATRVLNPALQRTALDRPAAVDIVEIFRQAALDALVPPRSTAPTAVVFYAAVQQSSLASLAPMLPGTAVLAVETPHLLAHDIASPVEVAAKLDAVKIFWPGLLQVLVRDANISPQIAELLDRAWHSEYPADRGGAIAAALLYAVHIAI